MVKPAVTSSGFQVDVPLGYSDVTVTKLEGTDVQVRLKSTTFLMNSQQMKICLTSVFFCALLH